MRISRIILGFSTIILLWKNRSRKRLSKRWKTERVGDIKDV